MPVRGHRRAGGDVRLGVARARRARDVGDRGDVVPVEPVPETERGHPEEQDDKAEVHCYMPEAIASCRDRDSCKTLAIAAVSRCESTSDERFTREERSLRAQGPLPLHQPERVSRRSREIEQLTK